MAMHIASMTSQLLPVLLVASVLFYYTSADLEEANAAQNLYTEVMFDHAVVKSPHFIMFFAPWCGHCKKLAPIWDELGTIYNGDDSIPLYVAKVDCTTETKVCHSNDVKGYPTLKFFSPGFEPVKYTGKRDKESLVAFIEEKLSKKKPDVPQPPEALHGLYELTTDTFKEHVATGNHFVKFYAPWCGHCKKLAPTWERLAEGFAHTEGITISKIDCTTQRPVCTEFGVDGFPTLKFFKNGEVVDTYKKPTRDHQALKEYVSTMMGGTEEEAPPTKEEKEKTEEAVETKESKVVVLTGDNFQEGIAKGLTLVKFFAPWCGHCKKLAPIFEELAVSLDDKPGLTAAEVDCTLHKETCSTYDVKGYPTMLLYNNGKFVEKYTSSRGLEQMYSFMLVKLKDSRKEEL